MSKTVPEDRLRLAVEAGLHLLGENRVQEATRKYHAMKDLDVEWSIIGNLQTNKARDVAAYASEFQALDRLRVAEVLNRRLEAAGRTLPVFVQVNTSNEPQKYGIQPDELPEFLAALGQYPAEGPRLDDPGNFSSMRNKSENVSLCCARCETRCVPRRPNLLVQANYPWACPEISRSR